MRTELSQSEINSYRDDGYLILDDFLDSEELAHYRQAVSAAVTGRGERGLPEDQRGVEQFAFAQVLNLWRDHPAVRPLVMNEGLGQMLCRLAGIDGVRIWHDQALCKQPWGNPTSWHKDNPYWSFTSPDAISIWSALADATISNGCLWVLPGSHRPARYQNAGIGADMRAIFEHYPDYAAIEAVPVELEAGSCSFHNGLTVHGAGANMTPRWRRAMTCAYMPDGAVYNGQHNILPQRLRDSLHEGDPLQDDDWNPLLYRCPQHARR